MPRRHSGSGHYDAFIQFVILGGTVAAAFIAWSAWQSEVARRRIDTTLGYIKELTDQTYVERLWEIQRFTMCFEKRKGLSLSYLSREEVAKDRPAFVDHAKSYWRLIETDETLEGVAKPEKIEERLYTVYSRISLTASCLESGLCDYHTFDRMSDAAEIETLLSISNYLKLSEETSVEWTISEDLERFLDRAYDLFSKRPSFMANRQRVRDKNCNG